MRSDRQHNLSLTIVVTLFVLLVSYVVAYYGLVQRVGAGTRWTALYGTSWERAIENAEDGDELSAIMRLVFHPANWLDRRLRPGFWKF